MLEAKLHDHSACNCQAGLSVFHHGPPRRRALLQLGALSPLLLTVGARAQTAPVEDTQENRIADLIEGNHILANENVLDGFGHISVRSIANPKHFFMSRSRAPGLVTRDDIMEFDEHSQPVDQRGREMYGERFIHGEVLGARPDVVAVVHSHSPDVIPFGVTHAPFQALIHMAAFLGATPRPGVRHSQRRRGRQQDAGDEQPHRVCAGTDPRRTYSGAHARPWHDCRGAQRQAGGDALDLHATERSYRGLVAAARRSHLPERAGGYPNRPGRPPMGDLGRSCPRQPCGHAMNAVGICLGGRAAAAVTPSRVRV